MSIAATRRRIERLIGDQRPYRLKYFRCSHRPTYRHHSRASSSITDVSDRSITICPSLSVLDRNAFSQ
jgi:hypothetical protein